MKQHKSIIFTKKQDIQDIQESLQKDIQDLYSITFYKPLADIFTKKKYTKPESKYTNLIMALRQGKIIYSFRQQGFFVADFLPKAVEELRSLQVMYMSGEKIYKIDYSMLPVEIQSIVSSIRNTNEKHAYKVVELLGAGVIMFTQIDTKPIIEKHFEKLTPLLQTIEPLKAVADVITEPSYAVYLNETEKAIKGWGAKEIQELRQSIVAKIERGADLSNLQSELMVNKNLSQSRAKLIARQEIVNATLEFEKARYRDAGITQFKWINPNPNEVNARPHHKTWGEMSKKGILFDANNPPQDPTTGKPEMPGEPFYCDCYPVYIS